MAWNYNKLWKMLIDKKMKKTDLKERCKVSSNVLAKMGKDEPVSMAVLEKICKEFDCDISDIVEYDAD